MHQLISSSVFSQETEGIVASIVSKIIKKWIDSTSIASTIYMADEKEVRSGDEKLPNPGRGLSLAGNSAHGIVKEAMVIRVKR